MNLAHFFSSVKVMDNGNATVGKINPLRALDKGLCQIHSCDVKVC